LDEDQRNHWQLIPAEFAALTAVDNSATLLPQRCFCEAIEKEDFGRFSHVIGKFVEQIGLPGYDGLLLTLDQLRKPIHEINFDRLRQLVAKGNFVPDCVWAIDNDLQYNLRDSHLSIRAMRRLGELFTQRGFPLNMEELGSLASCIKSKQHLEPIYCWLKWLGCVSPRAITPRVHKVLSATFWGWYLQGVDRAGWFEQLAPCLAPARRASDADNYRPLLDRIAEYQQLAGKKAALPKSLRKLLDVPQRRQRERKRLRDLQLAGVLQPSAQMRLRALESAGDKFPDAAKIRRAAEEVFLLVGIETLGTVARKLAAATCRKHLGDLINPIAYGHLWDFALWIDSMNPPLHSLLRTVVASQQLHGTEYKRHLTENRDWICRAIARGIQLDPWFASNAQVKWIDGRKVKIVLAQELRHIFLMGHYFGTCLSLGNFNQMSVLTNAYDANKQVVFMFSEDHAGQLQIIARQLIAISSDFKLLGYCCYVNATHIQKQHRQPFVDAMAAYCGRLASQCHLELANEGTPESIGDHFWYDDGECEWPAAAGDAWAETSPKTELAVLTS